MKHARYSPEPLNQQDGMRQIAREEAINAIQSQSITGSMVPRSVPQLSVDIPIVAALPMAPEDGQEVYLRVGDTSNGIAHMLYLASLPGWVQTGMPPVVTTLPSTPFDGMRVDYVADSTNGVVWSLRYRAAGSATYPWEFVGGSSLSSEYDADDTTSSTTFVALTNHLSVTIPVAGEYRLEHTVRQFYSTGGPGVGTVESVLFVNSTQANAYITSWDSQLGTPVTGANTRTKIALAVGDVVQQRSKTAAGTTGTFGFKSLTVTPIRVGA